ncbi:MAG: hypothetical protein AAFO01_23480, partial [Pseudomonadota bacterium]
RMDDRFVLTAVADENVVSEIFQHHLYQNVLVSVICHGLAHGKPKMTKQMDSRTRRTALRTLPGVVKLRSVLVVIGGSFG